VHRVVAQPIKPPQGCDIANACIRFEFPFKAPMDVHMATPNVILNLLLLPWHSHTFGPSSTFHLYSSLHLTPVHPDTICLQLCKIQKELQPVCVVLSLSLREITTQRHICLPMLHGALQSSIWTERRKETSTQQCCVCKPSHLGCREQVLELHIPPASH
jgi:hypothetical protein